ncbi:response regulator [uncultured Sneathiella sp.]|uniref:response regulator n=1 Tax=uncultured Sneathiella sp. TaxID=879315 RepID=UPI0030D8B257
MSKILLVEDETKERQFLKKILQRSGYEVAEATDGRHALRIFETFQPEIILTDLIMPELDGLELILKIRAGDPNIPIIAFMTTARKIGLSILKFSEDHGATLALAKPLTEKSLMEALTTLSKSYKVSRPVDRDLESSDILNTR